MTIGPSAPMTTLTLPYLVFPLLKLLGCSWFRLDPVPPLLPLVEIMSAWVSGIGSNNMGTNKELETVYDS
jgi:hypothetical protein